MSEPGQDRLNRRTFVARGLGLGAAAGFAGILDWSQTAATRAAGTEATTCAAPSFRTSLSVSPFTEQVLATPLTLTDGARTAKTVKQVQQLYLHHGATEVYARIGTLKHTGDNTAGNAESGLERGLERARLARDLGLPFNPELGLFAAYGDGATYQEPPDFSDFPSIRLPGPWTSLRIEQMIPPMRQYGALVAREILSTGVKVNYWDLGNEVENGISGVTVIPLFPDSRYQAPNNVDPQIGLMSVPTLVAMPESERIAWCRAHLWPYVGQLLKAARDGIRSVVPDAKFSTHISGFGHKTPAVSIAFWEAVKRVGYLPDVLGTSYYPTSGKSTDGAIDTVAWLRGVATAVGQQFGRQLFIAEYGYPSALMQPPYPFNDTVSGYPQTPQGQHDFTHDLVAWGIHSGRLQGLRPWAPDFCNNSAWAPMSWFTQSGAVASAKPAFHAIEEVILNPRCSSRLVLRVSHTSRRVVVKLREPAGVVGELMIELRRGRHTVARRTLATLDPHWRTVILARRKRRLPAGHYVLSVYNGDRVLAERRFRIA